MMDNKEKTTEKSRLKFGKGFNSDVYNHQPTNTAEKLSEENKKTDNIYGPTGSVPMGSIIKKQDKSEESRYIHKNTSSASNNNIMFRKIAGLATMLIGIIVGIFSAVTISDDMSGLIGYSYEPPLTSHEITMIVVAALSLILIIIGIILLCIKDKNMY